MALNQDHATLPKTPFSRTCVLTAAETAFNNPTNAVDLLLPADNTDGARVTRLYGIPRAAIATANNLQLYKKTAGGVYTFIDSVLITVHTPGASVAAIKFDFGFSLTNPMELEGGIGLAMAIGLGIANGVVGRCEGAFYAL
jgi:hypothetical protein